MVHDADENPERSRLVDSLHSAAGNAAGELWLGRLLLAGAVATAVLSFVPQAATRFYTWPWIYYWHVLLVLPPLAFVLGAMARRPAPRLGAALDFGMFLWAGGAFVAAWFSSFRPQSMDAALLPLASVCLGYVIRGWLGFDAVVSRKRAKQAFVVLSVFAAAFVGVSWIYWFTFEVGPALQAGAAWPAVWRIRNEHPLGHSIYTAGFVVLTLPLLSVMAIRTRGALRVPWVIAVILAAGLIATSGSRGGILGVVVLAAGGALLGCLHPAVGRRAKFAIVLGGLMIAILVVVASPRLRAYAAGAGSSAATAESDRQRTAMLEAGLAMGRDRPLLGHGPGTVSLVYPRYRARLSGGVENVLELHSMPVQVWAETGAVGLLAVLAVGVGVGMRAWRLRPGGKAADAGTAGDRARAWALVLAIGGYAVFALTDHQLDVPLFSGALAVMFALLSALTRPADLANVSWSPTLVRVLPALGVAFAAAVIVWYAIPNLRARSAFVAGVIAYEHGDAGAFVAGAQRAHQLAPGEPFYLNQLALRLVAEAEQTKDPERGRMLRHEAVTLFQRSLELRRDQEICHHHLAWLALELQAPEDAARHFRAAARLVPDKGGVYFGLGYALWLQGREVDAARAFALEWVNDPRAVAHSVWSTDEWRARRQAVAEAARGMLVNLAASAPTPELSGRAAFLEAVFAWWNTGTTEAAGRAAVASRDGQARDFLLAAADVAVTDAEQAAASTPPWRIVHEAWQAAEPMPVLARLPERYGSIRETLAQRIAQHRGSFSEFWTAPMVNQALVRQLRIERVAYNMLMRNSDGLRVFDRFAREQSLLVELLPSRLFPEKGWLPGPVLVELLESVPE